MALRGRRDGTQEGVDFRGTTSLAADAAKEPDPITIPGICFRLSCKIKW
jgi:hypothetical protein